MSRRGFAKFFPFLLVLIGTIALVAVLSAASRVSPEEAVNRYISQTESQQVQPEGLSAPAAEGPGISLIASLTGFLALLAFPVMGLLLYARACRKASRREEKRARRRSQRGRQDTYLQGTRYRV